MSKRKIRCGFLLFVCATALIVFHASVQVGAIL